MTYIDPSTYISIFADIEISNRGSKLEINDNCMIDSFVKIKFAGGNGDIIIGSTTYINSCTVIYSGNGITIGNNVAIGANCTLAPVNHAYIDKHKPIIEQRFLPSKGGIIIGNDVWIGANSVILDGTIIPDGCVIGALSLVKGKLQAYSVYAGNPLKKISSRE